MDKQPKNIGLGFIYCMYLLVRPSLPLNVSKLSIIFSKRAKVRFTIVMNEIETTRIF